MKASYKEWLKWREEYYMEERKDLGVGVVGNLKRGLSEPKKKSAAKRVTKKRVKEGAVNNTIRTTKVEYLRHHTKTVATVNEKGEYELKSTKNCGEGDVVWVLEDDNTFTRTKIY